MGCVIDKERHGEFVKKRLALAFDD